MTLDFPTLIAHAAKTRPLGYSTIIGSGTVSARTRTADPQADRRGGLGYSCIAERRTVETIVGGRPERRSALRRPDPGRDEGHEGTVDLRGDRAGGRAL